MYGRAPGSWDRGFRDCSGALAHRLRIDSCARSMVTGSGQIYRLIGKWPGGSDEDFDRTPYLTPQSHSERNPSTERTLSCAPSDCDSPPEPSQTSISSNSEIGRASCRERE